MNKTIGLRSWSGVPYTYCVKGETEPHRLSKSDFLLLMHCDGTEELTPSPQLEALAARGLIHEASEGEVLTDWQAFHFFGNLPVKLLTIELTERCNYNCLHCFNAADSERSAEELSLDDIRRILEGAVECGISHVMLTGGEPLLHRDFLEIVQIIQDKGLELYAVNTNGAFITQNILEEMKQIGSRPLMKISFDGIGFHDWMRNKEGAEERTIRAIRTCIENGFPVQTQTNINRRNLSCILPTLKAMDALGVDNTRVIRTTEAPRWFENGKDSCLTWNEYFDNALEIMQSYASEEHHMDLEFWQFEVLDIKKPPLLQQKRFINQKKNLRTICFVQKGFLSAQTEKRFPACKCREGSNPDMYTWVISKQILWNLCFTKAQSSRSSPLR
ncbi:MAG: radical SAM protein [Coriobacteriales bacterium]|nr:radical SAM protein [Coriobacteriales bacterium]